MSEQSVKTIPHKQLVWMYETMVRARKFDERIQTIISGFYHSGIGQEAVGVGTCVHLRPADYLLYHHRGCTQIIAKGLPLNKIFADFLGRVNGTCKGKGAGIVHISDPSLGILGQAGMLGGCFPLAFGAAYSVKYRKTDQVVVCFFGDGTANRGTFHESLNFAAVKKLPLVLVCENNKYGMSVPLAESTAGRIADRGVGFGVPGELVDGQDVLAVYQVTSRAIAHAKSGEGPYLIEADTCRFRGHYVGDDQAYRPKGEVEAYKKKDPIEIYRRQLLDANVLNGEELARIEGRIVLEVEEALKEAQESPRPNPTAIYEDVYA